MHEQTLHLNSTLLGTLNTAQDSMQTVLENSANSPSLGKVFRQSFGSSYDKEAAGSLIRQWKRGEFDSLPDIYVLSDQALRGANGAFASANQTIYISKDLLKQAQRSGDITGVVGVLLEEVGHFVDDLINPSDTPGDEGELFSALIQGYTLSQDELFAIQNEDDSALLHVDAQELSVELSSFGSSVSSSVGFTKNRGGWSDNNNFPRMMADVNGDGRADIVGFGSTSVFVSLGRGNGAFAAPVASTPGFTKNRGGWSDNNNFPRMMADVNGDGRADIVGFGSNSVFVSLSLGNGTFGKAIESVPSSTNGFTKNRGGWSDNNNFPRMMADVNGDGRADIVGFGSTSVFVSLGRGNGTFAAPVASSPGFTKNRGGWSDNNNFPRMMADVNGDGRADIVGFGSNSVFVSLSLGNGTFGQAKESVPSSTNGFTKNRGGWSDNNNFPRMMADVNGDRRADIIGFGSTSVFVSLGRGDSTFAAPIALNPGFTKNRGGWSDNNNFPRMMADVNGDRRADIVGFGSNDIFTSLAATNWTTPTVINPPSSSIMTQAQFDNWPNLSAYTTQNPFPWKGQNCTWYAHGRMLQLGYSKSALDTMLGNAGNWDNTAARGAVVVSRPQAPSIALWEAGVGGAGSVGHVAVVERVNSDGSIVISESNWNGRTYNTRTIHPGTATWPSKFITVPRA